MDLQNPNVQRILLTALLSTVILYVFFGSTFMEATYRSRKAEIAVLQEQHEALSRDLERARLMANNLPKLEQEYRYLHEQWLIAQNLLPTENEMATLLRKVSAAGQQSGLEFVQFKPNSPVYREYYTENPVFVEVEGGFHQVGTFLSQISNMNRIVNVRNVKLEGVKPEEQGKPEIRHSLKGELEIIAYTVPENAGVGEPGTEDLSSTNQRLGRAGTIGTVKEKLAEARKNADQGTS